jgi:hypothetical protein
MTLHAFTSTRPLKAAHDLREAGFQAFCLMMLDRRRKSRHTKGKIGHPVIGVAGYVFAADVDPWRLARMPNIHPVRKADGRWQPIRGAQADWLLTPPAPLFRDTEAHRHIPRDALPSVSPGDVVAFMLASERVMGEVLSTDGHTLTMKLRMAMLGRETMKVPLNMVEAAA